MFLAPAPESKAFGSDSEILLRTDSELESSELQKAIERSFQE